MTDPEPTWAERYARLIEVSIKIMAAAVVILFNIGTGPSEPKTVLLEPPNVAPMSAPLPCCRSTRTIRKKQTVKCTTVRIVSMFTAIENL